VNVDRSFASQRLSYPRYHAKTGSASDAERTLRHLLEPVVGGERELLRLLELLAQPIDLLLLLLQLALLLLERPCLLPDEPRQLGERRGRRVGGLRERRRRGEAERRRRDGDPPHVCHSAQLPAHRLTS